MGYTTGHRPKSAEVAYLEDLLKKEWAAWEKVQNTLGLLKAAEAEDYFSGHALGGFIKKKIENAARESLELLKACEKISEKLQQARIAGEWDEFNRKK